MSYVDNNEIRSLSDKEWYWISRAILKRYGRILKGSGIAVYNVLASYANSKSQSCFPTQKSIAEILRLSIRTVSRKLRLLKDFKLIRIKKIRSRCFYFLLKVDTTKETRLYAKRGIRDRTPGKSNNNKLIRINNKNKNVNENFHNFKPISRLLKKYDQKAFKNHRH